MQSVGGCIVKLLFWTKVVGLIVVVGVEVGGKER